MASSNAARREIFPELDLPDAGTCPRVGFLHITRDQPFESGVTRYGRLLAAELRGGGRAHVTEVACRAGEGGPAGALIGLAPALAALRSVDVIHAQLSQHLWRELATPAAIAAVTSLSGPRLVLTLHDPLPEGLERPPVADADDAMVRHLLRALLARAARVVVHSKQELQGLARLTSIEGVSRLPHFVERLELGEPRAEAKRRLGLEGKTVVTVLGFVSQRKNQDVLLRALPWLGASVHAVVAGGAAPRCEEYYAGLAKIATTHGVRDRVTLTGHLPDGELRRYLAATDLAVCPFTSFTASGSLSTWIAARVPVLCVDLPPLREYLERAPGSIMTIPAPRVGDLVAGFDAWRRQTENELACRAARLEALGRELHIARTAAGYLDVYRASLSSHARATALRGEARP